MKKLITVILIAASLTSTAQKGTPLKFSIGAELGAVTGNLNKVYSLAIGGTAQADFKIDNDLALTFNTGLIGLLGKTIPGTNLKFRSTALIPLLAGLKYYFTPHVYGSGQLGTSISTNTNGGSTFTYIPGIGYKFDERIDALLKYTGYASDGGTFGIRLAYTF